MLCNRIPLNIKGKHVEINSISHTILIYYNIRIKFRHQIIKYEYSLLQRVYFTIMSTRCYCTTF